MKLTTERPCKNSLSSLEEQLIFASVVEWSITTDCKSVGLCLRWFESSPAHIKNKSQQEKLRFIFDCGQGFKRAGNFVRAEPTST